MEFKKRLTQLTLLSSLFVFTGCGTEVDPNVTDEVEDVEVEDSATDESVEEGNVEDGAEETDTAS